MRSFLVGTLLVLWVSGCSSTVRPLMPTVEGDITDRSYTPVADVESQVFYGGVFDSGTPEQMCLDKMVGQAVEQRADALIFVRYGEKGFDFLLRQTERCSSRAVRFSAH